MVFRREQHETLMQRLREPPRKLTFRDRSGGPDGVPVEEFLSVPADHWFDAT